MSHRLTLPFSAETVTSYDLEIAARARPVFVLSWDLLGRRNHIMVIPRLEQRVEIPGTAKSKLAGTKKPATPETAAPPQDWGPGAEPEPVRLRWEEMAPGSAPVTRSEERRAPPAQARRRQGTPGSAQREAATPNPSDRRPERCGHAGNADAERQVVPRPRDPGSAKRRCRAPASDTSGGVVKESIRYGRTNDAVTKKPLTRKKRRSATEKLRATRVTCAVTEKPPTPRCWRNGSRVLPP
nr:uncharacterized protein LOC104651032 [Saimiri boliviensis boliviensis]